MLFFVACSILLQKVILSFFSCFVVVNVIHSIENSFFVCLFADVVVEQNIEMISFQQDISATSLLLLAILTLLNIAPVT